VYEQSLFPFLNRVHSLQKRGEPYAGVRPKLERGEVREGFPWQSNSGCGAGPWKNRDRGRKEDS